MTREARVLVFVQSIFGRLGFRVSWFARQGDAIGVGKKS